MATVKTSDRVELYYELEGEEDARTLLFSNSLGANLGMWEAQRARFSEHFRLLLYDSRGHGRSGVAPGPYTIERLGADVVNLLDALGIGKVSFCGLSKGGMVGMWLGAKAPERIERLVLCSTSAHMPPAEAWRERAQLARAGRLEEIAGSVMERWFTPSFRVSRPEVVEKIHRQFLATSPEGYAASCEAIGAMDQREAIGDIGLPTLVISSSLDPATPPEHGQFIARRIAGAQYAEIADAAHLSNFEQPERFNAVVGEFLL